MGELNPELQTMILKAACRRSIEGRDRILHDLGIAGTDAWELLEAIHDRFGTSFETMPFAEFFPYDFEAFGSHWYRLLGFKSRKRCLTVAHLADVVAKGEWFEP